MSKIVDKLFGCGVPKSPSAGDIRSLSYKQLQALLGKLKLPKSGKKEELVKRLCLHYGLPSEVEEGSEGADSEEKQKRKWTKTDPARFAPNEYHENLFRANFPFVNTVRVPVDERFPGVDKFEGEVLDRVAKAKLFNHWTKAIVEANSYFRKPANEKQSTPQHFALLQKLGNFSRIAPHEVQRLSELVGQKRKWMSEDAEDVQCKGCQREPMDCRCEANKGIEIQFSAEDMVSKKPSKNKGLEIAPEDPSVLEGDLEDPDEVTGYADAVLYVWDDRVRKRRRLETGPSSEPTLIDTQRAVCVVERKFVDDKYKSWAPFQGAYYGVKNEMRNIQKGHLLPIYIVVLTGTEWTYGKVEPCGLVALQDGRVDPASMDSFASHQKQAGHGGKITYEVLQEQLEAGTAFYRKNYKDNPNAHFRDQTMLVGTFYLSSQWYPLPHAHVSGGFRDAGVHRLFDGLLRVVVGDSVLEWKKEDFDDVYRRRKEFIRTCRDCGID